MIGTVRVVHEDLDPPEAGALVERGYAETEARGGEAVPPELQARSNEIEPEPLAGEVRSQSQANVYGAVVGVVKTRQLPSGTVAEEPHQLVVRQHGVVILAPFRRTQQFL